MTFLDTDITVDYLVGQPRAVNRVLSLRGRLAISIVTYGEVYEGIRGEPGEDERTAAFERALRDIMVAPVDRLVALTWADLRKRLRSTGNAIPDADLLIAATAVTHRAVLVSGNRRHFERIADLKFQHYE